MSTNDTNVLDTVQRISGAAIASIGVPFIGAIASTFYVTDWIADQFRYSPIQFIFALLAAFLFGVSFAAFVACLIYKYKNKEDRINLTNSKRDLKSAISNLETVRSENQKLKEEIESLELNQPAVQFFDKEIMELIEKYPNPVDQIKHLDAFYLDPLCEILENGELELGTLYEDDDETYFTNAAFNELERIGFVDYTYKDTGIRLWKPTKQALEIYTRYPDLFVEASKRIKEINENSLTPKQVKETRQRCREELQRIDRALLIKDLSFTEKDILLSLYEIEDPVDLYETRANRISKNFKKAIHAYINSKEVGAGIVRWELKKETIQAIDENPDLFEEVREDKYNTRNEGIFDQQI